MRDPLFSMFFYCQQGLSSIRGRRDGPSGRSFRTSGGELVRQLKKRKKAEETEPYATVTAITPLLASRVPPVPRHVGSSDFTSTDDFRKSNVRSVSAAIHRMPDM